MTSVLRQASDETADGRLAPREHGDEPPAPPVRPNPCGHVGVPSDPTDLIGWLSTGVGSWSIGSWSIGSVLTSDGGFGLT
ncbi:hypothetical protein A606_03020 [Corynebacterium terpenotabidum Y-11]|uniref:Uncharacterized protein n=1 Tax=Corynebacterium terpenotabidum Y-11 TaxID=1200352 RepID=S4XAU3_9CORY|nr:hypothetical protein A606_03020 [Corynebacterium terpenotabidum Y-11]